VSNLSKREEIATRLACAMLTNSDAMTRTAADRLPYVCAKMASDIIEECDAQDIVVATEQARRRQGTPA